MSEHTHFLRTLADDSPMSRMMSLMELHCPRLMRAGGPLSRENHRRDLTASERARIIASAKHSMTLYDVTVETGWSQAVVSRVIAAAGVLSPQDRIIAAKRERVAELLRATPRPSQARVASICRVSSCVVSKISQQMFGKLRRA